MAVTVQWTPAVPADSDDPRDGASDIRDLKQALHERLNNGGHKWDSVGAGTDTEDGRHCCGVEEADVWNVYESADHDTICFQVNETTFEVLAGDEAESANAFTLKIDTIEADRINSVDATAVADGFLRGYRYHSVAVPLPGSATGVQPGVLFKNMPGNGALVIDMIQLMCFGTPVTTNLEVDVNYITSASTATNTPDPSTGGTTILAAVLQVTAGDFWGAELTTGAFTGAANSYSLAEGDALQFAIDTLSAATDIVVLLRVRRIL